MKKQPGFTLIEVVLAIGLFSLLALAAVNFISAISAVRAKGQAIREVGEQGRMALMIIEQTLNKAESVLEPAAGATGSTLSLDVLDTGADPTVFGVASNILVLTEGTNPTVSLTSDRVLIDALTFTNLAPSGAPGSIRTELTLSYAASENSPFKYSETFYSTATLRLR